MKNGTVLFVDDEKSWYETIDGILKDEGYDVIWAPNKATVQTFLEENRQIDVAITNLNLRPSSLLLDATGYIILEYLRDQCPHIPKVVISSLRDLPNTNKPSDGVKMAKKVIELYERYGVDHVAIKGEINTNEFINKINGIISMKGNVKAMNWETILTTVVSAVTPYATVLGTSTVSAVGSKIGETIFQNVQKLWEWIYQSIESKGDEQDRKLWDEYKTDPIKNQGVLAQMLLRLVPAEDIELRQTTQKLIQELYRFLDNYDNFTLVDLKRICSRLNVHWENEVPNPTTEALARWVANYAQTRHKEQELVIAIFEINPGIFPKK